jgi:hypothetical protein
MSDKFQEKTLQDLRSTKKLISQAAVANNKAIHEAQNMTGGKRRRKAAGTGGKKTRKRHSK